MTGSDARKQVLFLCTGNSCRSQMAEGFINQLLGEAWQARSAGTHPAARVHPLAVQVMAELGIDISGGRPTAPDELLDHHWDLVITVCNRAQETCPIFPRAVEHSTWASRIPPARPAARPRSWRPFAGSGMPFANDS